MGERKTIVVDRDMVKSIALMSIPAAGIAFISLPFAIVLAIATGISISQRGSDGAYEIELPSSFSDWLLKDNPVYQQRIYEDAKKRASALYWTHKSEDTQP